MPWVAIGVAVLVSVIGAVELLKSGTEDVAAQAAITAGAPATKPEAPVPGMTAKPREVDASVLATHQSMDARRAGYAAYATGDIAGAVAQYQAAVDANPRDAEARNGLGQVLVREKRAAEALPHFDEAVRLDGEKWAYRFNRARAYAQMSRWAEAAADYRAASALFPDDYATFYNLGLVLMRAEQHADAVAALEQAVALAPGEPSFLIALARASIRAEKPNRAKAAFEKFLEIAPDDAEAPKVKAALTAMAVAK